jgi:hypothetical protein
MKFLTYIIPLLFIVSPAMAMPLAALVTVGAAAFKSAVVNFIISAVVGAAVSSIFGGGKKRQATQATRSRSIMVNKNSSNEPIPVVYGRRRVGGTRVFVGTSDGSGGSGSNTLNIALALCEGQMGNLKKIYFNDQVVFDGTLTHGNTVTDSNDVSSNKYEATFEIQYMDGRDDQTVSTTLQNSIGSSTWTSNHRLRGVAYLGIKLTADADKYSGGVPTITAELDGKKITSTADFSSTVDGADQNPVDVLNDYLTNTRYGKGLVAGDIDQTSFTTARAHIVANSNFYKINGALQTDIPLYENIQEILNASNLILVYTNGKYVVKNKKQNETATYTITKDNIIDAMQVDMPTKKNKKNKITVTFPDASSDYNYNENIKVVDDSSFLTADNNQVLESRIELDLVTDATLAESLATYKMKLSRNTLAVSFTTAHTNLPIECGDIIKIINSDFGFSDSDNKLFRVIQMEITTEATIKFVCQEYNSSIELT